MAEDVEESLSSSHGAELRGRFLVISPRTQCRRPSRFPLRGHTWPAGPPRIWTAGFSGDHQLLALIRLEVRQLASSSCGLFADIFWPFVSFCLVCFAGGTRRSLSVRRDAYRKVEGSAAPRCVASPLHVSLALNHAVLSFVSSGRCPAMHNAICVYARVLVCDG